MTKTEYTINFKFAFDPAHKGASYTLDGEHYMNGGEFAEIADKMVKGLGSKKDANTPFDKGSDIEETDTSVKSSKAQQKFLDSTAMFTCYGGAKGGGKSHIIRIKATSGKMLRWFDERVA